MKTNVISVISVRIRSVFIPTYVVTYMHIHIYIHIQNGGCNYGLALIQIKEMEDKQTRI
jgi:hypothetical protein